MKFKYKNSKIKEQDSFEELLNVLENFNETIEQLSNASKMINSSAKLLKSVNTSKFTKVKSNLNQAARDLRESKEITENAIKRNHSLIDANDLQIAKDPFN
jgi:hypothetical protein